MTGRTGRASPTAIWVFLMSAAEVGSESPNRSHRYVIVGQDFGGGYAALGRYAAEEKLGMSQTSWAKRNGELLIALAGTLMVLLVRLWFGRHLTFCGTPDSCAYLALAESLSNHHGFVENFLYDFQLDNLQLPTHGIEYWLPGTSFFLLLAKPFGGVTLYSSIVISTLAGVFLSMAAWQIASDSWGNRRIACASYLLCLVLPPLWIGSITPDSALFYAAFVGWFLALFRVNFRSYTEDALAFLCLVIANLIRNDVILLLVPVVVVLSLRWRSAEKRGVSRAYCAVVVVGFFAATIPMHVIDYAVLGQAFPPGASKVLYMNDLSDMSKYNEPATLHSMLSVGLSRLIKMRVAAFPLIVYRIIFLMIGFSSIFIPALGLRRGDGERRGAPEFAGGVAFAITLVLVYSFVLPAIGSFSALRTFGTLLPLSAVLIVAGVRRVAGASRMAAFLVTASVLFYFVAGTMEDRRTVPEMNEIGSKDRLVASFLASRGVAPSRDRLIMTGDPAQFSETTAYAAIPLPENGLVAARQAADDLGATRVLIDTDKLKGTMAEVQSTLDATDLSPVPETHIVVVTLRPHPGSKQGSKQIEQK